MNENNTTIRRGTSIGAVLCGVLATIGMATLLTPIVAMSLSSGSLDSNSSGAAIPVLGGLLISTLVGGYVAGRAAGWRTSWHGLMAGMVGLFAVCVTLLLGIAAQRGSLGFGVYSAVPEIFPPLLTVGLYHSEPALAFGLLFGLPAQIIAAWLGGLLAPHREITVVKPVVRPPQTYTTDGGRLHPMT